MQKGSREYYQKEVNVILSILKLQEIIDNHIHKDELAGYHLVVPIDTFQLAVTKLQNLLIGAVELKIMKNNSKYKPLRDMIEVLEKRIDINNKKYNHNEGQINNKEL